MGNPVSDRALAALVNPLVPLLAQPADLAALPTVYAATQPLPPGSYVGPGGLGEMRGWPTLVGRSQAAADPALAARFWELAAAETDHADPS